MKSLTGLSNHLTVILNVSMVDLVLVIPVIHFVGTHIISSSLVKQSANYLLFSYWNSIYIMLINSYSTYFNQHLLFCDRFEKLQSLKERLESIQVRSIPQYLKTSLTLLTLKTIYTRLMMFSTFFFFTSWPNEIINMAA